VVIDVDERQLQDRIQEFIRQFGLLDQEHTPCGRPMPTSQAHALQILGRVGIATQRELAGRLNLDESTVSRLVNQLVGRGWVDRAIDEHNRRQSRLALTGEGRAALDDIRDASAAKFRLIRERIPPDKGDQVLEALDILIAAIGKDTNSDASSADQLVRAE
jgi:DNA-binding MarR family transcriptional regulator